MGIRIPALSVGLFVASATVMPVAAATGVIEEIVVTARQRAESLQEAPVTLTAVSGEEIERLALNNLDQLSDLVPNLYVSYGSSGGTATVTLRGIGTGSSSAGFSSAVGLLIDDLHFERGRWVQGGMVDLEQVEVLKGPQALYFGKNNTSGLIILRTRDPVPGAEPEAHFKAGYEFDAAEYLAEAGVSASLSDTFAIRLAGRYTEQTDGWIKNDAQPQVDPVFGFNIPGAGSNDEMPKLKDRMARFTALWTPNDRFTAKFKSSLTSTEDAGPIFHDQIVKCNGPNGQARDVFGVPSPGTDCEANHINSKSNIPAGMMAGEPDEFGNGDTFNEYDAWRVSLRLDYDLGPAVLSSVTGFAHYDSDLLDNATFATDAQVPFFERTDHDSFSQEVRVQTQLDGALNFLGGFLYTDKDLYFRNSARIAPLPPDSRNGRQWTWDKVADQGSESWSVFGELIWDITDRLELAGGARYTDEQRNFLFTVPHLHEVFDVFLPGILSSQTLEGVFKDDDTSPQITLTFTPNERLMLFGAYREGFKSGGFDASHTLAPGPVEQVLQNIRFESEKADGFEFGLKSQWLDGSVRLNATAYFFDYDELQLSTLDTETTQFRIQNVAAASTDGVEIEMAWAPSADLTLRGFLNLNNAKYDDFLTSCYGGQSIEAGCNQGFNPATGRYTSQDVGGSRVPVAPKWSATLGFTYATELGASGWRATLDLDARHSGAYSNSLEGIPDSREPSYTILDGSLRVTSPDDHWELTLIGRNLFDNLVSAGRFDRPLCGEVCGQGLPAGDPALGYADTIGRVLRGRQIWLQATYRL